jgi:diadenosine tetraphosphate (Ap4A) HIT family hydrolase
LNPSLLYENNHFIIEHSMKYHIPGYLFVSPKVKVYSLSELSDEALVCLGTTLSIAVKAVEIIIKPINVYCSKFGESGSPLHFHIFPRTQWITELYKGRFNDKNLISGPILLDWAIDRFGKGQAIVDKELEIQEVLVEMKDYFDKLISKNNSLKVPPGHT